MPPVAVVSRSNSVGSEKSADLESHFQNASPSAPFGLPLDPNFSQGSSLTSAHVVASSAVYSLADRIFSYISPGADSALDAGLQLWKSFQRKNANGIIPQVSRFEVRSGAASSILGYLSNVSAVDAPVSVVIPSSALPFMQPILSTSLSVHHKKVPLPLAFNVAALDYDSSSSSFVSDYATPLSFAKSLNFPVITPFNAVEAQHFSLFVLFLALQGPILNIYDGPSFLKENGTVSGLLSSVQLLKTFNELKSESKKLESADNKVSVGLKLLNQVLGTNYKAFEYEGHAQPETVFVIYGSTESELLLQYIKLLSVQKNSKIGAIAVRVPLPFDVAEFCNTIPESTQSIVVIGQTKGELATTSWLKSDVSAALFFGKGAEASPKILEYNYLPSFNWSRSTLHEVLSYFVSIPEFSEQLEAKKFLFWGPDNGELIEVPSKLAHSFSLDASSKISFRSKYDNINGAGTFQASIFSAPFNSKLSKAGSVDSADVILIEGKDILKYFDVTKTAKTGSTIIITSAKKIEELQKYTESLPSSFIRSLISKNIRLAVLDLEAIGDQPETKGFTSSIASQVAFWHYAYPELSEHDVVLKVWQAAGADAELLAAVISNLRDTVLKTGLKEVPVSKELLSKTSEKKENENEEEKQQQQQEEEEKESEEEDPELPSHPLESSFFPNPREGEVVTKPISNTKLDAAKKLVFKEAYQTETSLRPDLSVRNFVVKVQHNKRVTPENYSRNIFEIEFDITGTGLTYQIGEALGIHGRNNTKMVQEFLDSYGLKGDDLVQVPSKEDAHILETRTISQAFIENLDIFGKPPKKFYESLAPFAQDEAERKKLEFLASAAGAKELKAYQDDETYFYADILALFPSARPSVVELAQIISPLKRREYSIASSQKMHPNAVHLLIVVVDWVDKRGQTRYGHCSHYLSQLSVGTELVVSVKPSVMKLPASPLAPIVMSGLGTGLAPFKAFVEEKVWQKSQGLEIGEIYLYLGSRYKREEYLYGELWEAYKDAGIITHIGAAFSRDQPEKIYIQDRIRENIEELTDAIITKNGSFYLCGPTWPVPDITACLEDIVQNDWDKRGVKGDVANEVEEMKESGRYVLEVY
ncbi:hypothetical protein PACTADRAFT_50694 [Pachysolen tannophilus NRRL Y-2460]|uniref:assimilatory sulfite reductase (NADPH) n=1 Tax=Pachysolen tannophilus NRRL Y-2460 TaxID=669874 RepID=A0A1E4TSX6_PACTA|nr:hypothetical protein PACTADRAFT_50694 [Pachysolen tannophilus NRRL Y-2460]